MGSTQGHQTGSHGPALTWQCVAQVGGGSLPVITHGRTDGDLLGEGARESEREIKRGLEKAGHCHDTLLSQTSEQSNLPQQAGVPDTPASSKAHLLCPPRQDEKQRWEPQSQSSGMFQQKALSL